MWQQISTRIPSLLLALIVAGILAGVQTILLTSQRTQLPLAMDDRAAALFLTGVHDLEADTRSSFRWASGDNQLLLRQLPWGGATALSLALGPPPPGLAGTTARISIGGQPILSWPVSSGPRTYRLLVPPARIGDGAQLRLQTASATVPPDTRLVGLRLERITVQPVGSGVI